MSQSPMPFKFSLIFAGIFDGSFICAYVGMTIFRSLARLIAFARRDFSMVRSMVVIAFSCGKLSDNLNYISQSVYSQYAIAFAIAYCFRKILFERMDHIQHKMFFLPRRKVFPYLLHI